MKQILFYSLVLFASVFVDLAAPQSTAAEGVLNPILISDQGCFKNEDARIVGNNERLVSLKDAAKTARRTRSGDFLNISLCKLGDGYVYRFGILGAGGAVNRVFVDAHTGQVIQ